jgi:hypothetical protein
MLRRSFLVGLTSALAAPAIVRAQSLMRVRGLIMPNVQVGMQNYVTPREAEAILVRHVLFLQAEAHHTASRLPNGFIA